LTNTSLIRLNLLRSIILINNYEVTNYLRTATMSLLEQLDANIGYFIIKEML